MRIIAIEEHFALPKIRQATSGDGAARSGGDATQLVLGGGIASRLEDLGAGRLAAMDDAGIDVQVLSHAQPGVEGLDPREAVPLARDANDALAEAVQRHPDRFAGFAMLPTTAPEVASDELERTVTSHGFKGALVNGRTGDRFLDDQFFWPIFQCAERLQVPIYLHPASPPQAVQNACYAGLPVGTGDWLARAAWGWHMETGLHALRLIAAGVFDRFPKLQIVIGHMGEAIPFMLERTNARLPKHLTGLERQVKEYFLDNFHVTTSGFFSPAPLLCLAVVAGLDRLMFAVDYPFSPNEEGRAFLEGAPLSALDLEKVAHLNAERLLGL